MPATDFQARTGFVRIGALGRTPPLAPASRTAAARHPAYGDQAKASQPSGGGRGVREGAARGRRVQAAAGRGEALSAPLQAWRAESELQGVRRGVDMRARPPTPQVQGVQIMTGEISRANTKRKSTRGPWGASARHNEAPGLVRSLPGCAGASRSRSSSPRRWLTSPAHGL